MKNHTFIEIEANSGEVTGDIWEGGINIDIQTSTRLLKLWISDKVAKDIRNKITDLLEGDK